MLLQLQGPAVQVQPPIQEHAVDGGLSSGPPHAGRLPQLVSAEQRPLRQLECRPPMSARGPPLDTAAAAAAKYGLAADLRRSVSGQVRAAAGALTKHKQLLMQTARPCKLQHSWPSIRHDRAYGCIAQAGCRPAPVSVRPGTRCCCRSMNCRQHARARCRAHGPPPDTGAPAAAWHVLAAGLRWSVWVTRGLRLRSDAVLAVHAHMQGAAGAGATAQGWERGPHAVQGVAGTSRQSLGNPLRASVGGLARTASKGQWH